ncbi:hypothetical protein PFNF135_01347 [Plasmodium falciparum NF135/5.C10]|uniref:Duffy-binding-like domain-containing protein n=1 Tax=Plasmodium falciparum NF135/5.C10 TaxID=1036726 RepID=W4IMG3_PLAFA|nr:hypothetical protein PFNF135_01347 [Plasmodium falciparum NF135/5.C10]
MALGRGGRGGGDADKYKDAQDAKHLLDQIGEDVYKKVKEEAKNYIEKLKGDLNTANGRSSELKYTTDTCDLVQEYYKHPNGGGGNGDPCGIGKDAKNEHVKRFSDTLGGQCTYNRIKDSENNTAGACAPYRRLYLCNKNLETISDYDSTKAKHKLLAEVCMAAYYEGDIIKTHYTQHERTNEGTASQLCTVLARSFADIGDIVRGKDLYLGYDDEEKKQRKQLDENLKTIFAKIHSEVTRGKTLQERYQDDDKKNYYQLREDWWTANRETVWKAITCGHPGGTYFRPTCSDTKGESVANHKCRCPKTSGGKANDQVPTYFDYVPQYLRWFEEWGEDFCRKKKKRLEDVKTNCRNETEKYCSGNGYDCTKTIYKKGKLVISSECTKCSVWCRLYETWIDNQKKEFLKQRKKYETEISNSGSCGGSGGVKGRGRKKRSISGSDGNKYDGYEKKFYDELKGGYEKVNNFLELLNKEATCKAIGDKKEKINFDKEGDDGFHKNINKEGTFYHSEYCEVCPGCGVERKGLKEWTQKKNGTCDVKKPYKILHNATSNDIEVLSFGDKGNEIKSKIDKFCLTQNGKSGKDSSIGSGDCGGNSDPSLCEPWQCYKHNEVQKDDDDDEDPDYVKNAGGLCILPNPKKKKDSGNNSSNEPDEFQKTFNDFFYFWIRRFLNDSMYWRDKINNCIEKAKKGKCKNECNTKCECFLKWIGKKKTEWKKIKDHFKTQEGIPEGFTHDALLKYVLNIDELFKDIKDGYGDVKELKGIKNMLDEEKKKNQQEAAGVAPGNGVNGGKDNTTIDKLLKHEGEEAETCKENNPEKCPEDTAGGAGGRSLPGHTAGSVEDDDDDDGDEDDEEEEEEKEEEEKEEDEEEEEEEEEEDDKHGGADGPKEATEVTDPSVDVCKIVGDALKLDTLKQACPTKYGKNAPSNWKCIPSGVTTTGSSGAICVPPRRRRLYVKKLHDWAKSDETLHGGESSPGGEKSPVSGGNDTHVSGQAQTQSPVASNSTLPTSATSSRAQSDPLLTAFVESAAIETFFLWHKYKVDKAREKSEKQDGLVIDTSQLGKELQKELEKSGNIPEEFKRQMFYTLGDYRDICIGKTPDGIDTVSASGDNPNKKVTMKDISDKIEKILPKNGGTTPTPGPPQTSGIDPKAWWETNGQHIWEGMICALTYTDSSEKPTQDKDLKEKLWDTTKNKPKEDKYQYTNAKLEEENSGEKTTLTDFISRPPYFRWLEEWGETFCRERKKRLEKIEEECMDGKQKKCSGDGEHCDENLSQKYTTFPTFYCPSCSKPCGLYKRWIQRKSKEFEEQKSAYTGQKEKCQTQSNGAGRNNDNNGFCETLQRRYNDTAAFLKTLGSCKNDNVEDNGKGKTIFEDNGDTFEPAKDCKPCSKFNINCNNGNCNDANGKECKDNKITAENIKTSTEDIGMLVSDDNTNGLEDIFEECVLGNCADVDIFKGFREDVWTCGKVCGYNVCKPKKVNGKQNDKNQIIIIRALFKRWLEYFLEDYNKIRTKLKPCMNKVEQSPCIIDYEKKYKCVKQWIHHKRTEWDKIKKHYTKHNQDNDMTSLVKNFLEELQPQTDVNKAIKPCKSLENFEKSCGLNSTDNSQNGKDNDLVLCMLNKLEKKIDECKKKHDETPPNTCDDFPTQTYIEPLDPDSPDDHMHHIQQPKFCPPPPETPLTCVEKIAKELREEAEGKINDELKGTGLELNGKCNKLQKNDAGTGEQSCEFEKTYKKSLDSLDQQCKGKGKERFKIGNIWKCEYIKDIGQNLCIPPRRKAMCIKHLKNITTRNVTNSTELLQKIQEAAKHEGDDIIRKILEENSCDEHRICDAMKYSFADIGDIIRGIKIWNNHRKPGIQTRLEYIFGNIFKTLNEDNKKKYKDEFPYYYKLRSDWWDVNRKDIWNAMTCNVPQHAKFLKKHKKFSSGTSSPNSIKTNDPKCGHDSEPPDYDYIPQPFRWMQEWSEYYCKALTDEIKKLNEGCKECTITGLSCQNDEDGTKCKSCKDKCKSYNDFVNTWKQQLNIQSKQYKDLYYKANGTGNDAQVTSGDKRKVRTVEDSNTIEVFLKNVKTECSDPESGDKYLDKSSNCNEIKFTNSNNNNNDNYAFKNPPKEYEKACECDPPDPLNDCPKDKVLFENICKNFSSTKLYESKTFNNDADSWTSYFLQKSPGNYTGVLVPPRRGQLYVKNITTKLRSIDKNKARFKTELMNCAYNEGKLLGEKYKDKEKAFQAMEYSFYDYGDIVKGTDMMDNWKTYNTKLDEVFKTNDGNEITNNRGKWWNDNRTQVWHAMLCGYQSQNNSKMFEENWCTVPTDDNTDQFLRWFREWSEHFCARQKELYQSVKKECESSTCDSTNGIMEPADCEEACTQYRDYITKKKQEYRIIMNQYNTNFKKKQEQHKSASGYFNDKCNSKCDCLNEYIDKEKKWEEIYGSFNDNDLKKKCVCKRSKPQIKPNRKKPKEEPPPTEPKQKEDQSPKSVPDTPPRAPTVNPPLPGDEPFNRDILEKTIPFGIALALGSIAFLFIKKKPKSPVDLLRVLDIHKGDYRIPTTKSANRYIPYASDRYKGKTYIYMEGDTSGDEDKYAFMSDTTDITSSESEYEELDINDIYAPRAPKYKTLIEVVLEPSKRDIQSDDIPSSDIPHTNKFTDEEWNQLKHDFISQYLPNTEPNNNYRSGDIPLNTQPNTLYFDKPEEKPFITSIHDRDLYTGEEYSYNVNMVNSMDDIPINRDNNVYSGIDLINDALNGDYDIYDEILKRKENELFGTNHVKHTTINRFAKPISDDPIHNQLELFHKWLDRHRDMCNTWNTKEELLDKLNEQWNKENNNNSGTPSDNTTPTSDIPSGKQSDIPSDNNIHSDIPYVLNTDVSIQIHMDNPKPINEFTYVDSNPNQVDDTYVDSTPDNSSMDTILEDLDKPFNEPYYYDMYDDDIYYDVNDHDTSTVDSNAMDVPSKVQIEMDVNTKLVKEKYPIADVWDI